MNDPSYRSEMLYLTLHLTLIAETKIDRLSLSQFLSIHLIYIEPIEEF